MRAKTTTVIINIGPLSKVSKVVWDWEIPVLDEIYGGGCEVIEHGSEDIKELPEAGGEFARMQDAYRGDENTGVAHVENAYGRGKSGFTALKKAIAKSAVKAKKVAQKTTKKPKSDPAPIKEKESSDSLV